jgi:hypothetical protein
MDIELSKPVSPVVWTRLSNNLHPSYAASASRLAGSSYELSALAAYTHDVDQTFVVR